MHFRIKAFTLIELLVVVAIIGILAAVGVVAYNGYTNSAKVAVIKNNLQLIVRYGNAELRKCDLGLDRIFEDSIFRGTQYPIECRYLYNTSTTKVFNSLQFVPAFRFQSPIDNGIHNKSSQHAFAQQWCRWHDNTTIQDRCHGRIITNYLGGWPMKLKTCFRTPCSDTKNVLTALIDRGF